MTTILADRSTLQLAEWTDIQALLRDQYEYWGIGMGHEASRDALSMQMRQPWGRHNLRLFVLRDGQELVAGAKIYTLHFQARGRQYKVAGVGAVWTMKCWRGRGHGSQLMKALEELADAEEYDALLLFSDIGEVFYEHLDYELMSDHEFYIWLNDSDVERQIMSDTSFVEDLHEHTPELSLLDKADIPEMARHYARYLTTVPFGLVRSEDYWQFKLAREQFFQEHSRPPRPNIELMSLDMGSASGGYALFEQAGKIMRVLEVVGRSDAREILWRNLLRNALLRRVQLIRGWEAAAPPSMRGIKYVERDLAKPMLLPLGDHDSWLDVLPCPLLELDHF